MSEQFYICWGCEKKLESQKEMTGSGQLCSECKKEKEDE